MLTAAYIALPVLLAACVLIKKRPVSSLICGVLIFAFFMLVLPEHGNGTYYYAYETFPTLSGHLDAGSELPVGFAYPARLLSMLFPEPFALTAAFSLIFAYGTMKYISGCDDPAVCALIACAGGFIPLAVKEPCFFTAMVLCACAFRYASRQQFLRFAVFMLLACCFYFDAILLLPLFVIFLIPAGLPLLLGGSAAAGVLLMTQAMTMYFDRFSDENAVTVGEALPVCIALAVLCIAAGLMKKLMTGGVSRAKPEQMIKLLFSAAFLSLCAIFETRLLPLAVMCAFPSAISVGGALAKTVSALIKMTFREKSGPVVIGAAAFGAVLLGVWYGLMLSGGAYVS